MAFSWGNPWNWLRARRHLLATVFLDTTNRKRKLWVEIQANRTDSNDFRFDIPDVRSEFSFIVLGDTGEGDSSQLVLVDKFLKEALDTSFTIIASDVVYPAGRSHDYREHFYVPYRGYPGDIYAIPGNHDWYDELVGFMIHFCDLRYHYGNPRRETIEPTKLELLRAIRHNRSFQPNMYFYIDTPHVRIVLIDTGIKGCIDEDQELWLKRISLGPKPKILVSGKPIYANGKYDKRLVNIDHIVNEYNYCLVIAGDTHNFQKYRVPISSRLGDRFVWHLVNGGGGAFLSRTHTIPPLSAMRLPVRLALEPDDFECYPTRETSRAYYGGWWRQHAPDWAVDWDQPPYHKSFVKVSVERAGLQIQVFAVENFGHEWIDRGPYREWHIPYPNVAEEPSVPSRRPDGSRDATR